MEVEEILEIQEEVNWDDIFVFNEHLQDSQVVQDQDEHDIVAAIEHPVSYGTVLKEVKVDEKTIEDYPIFYNDLIDLVV